MGYNLPFNAAVTALPMLLVLGIRRREVLYLAALGMLTLALCHIERLGSVLNIALPNPIMWRARWFVPAFFILATIGAVLSEAMVRLLTVRRGSTRPVAWLLSPIVVLTAFGVMLATIPSPLRRPGPPPTRLTKFSDTMHELVGILGGVTADPFVWGTFQVNHELCQLMPHIRLVMTRDSIILPADHPDCAALATRTRDRFRDRRLTQSQFNEFVAAYPVDRIITLRHRGAGDTVANVLWQTGWRVAGSAGPYDVWQHETSP